jgi:hypothetical protein
MVRDDEEGRHLHSSWARPAVIDSTEWLSSGNIMTSLDIGMS